MRCCSSALTPLVLREFCWHIDCSCLLSSVASVRSSWRISLFEEAMIAAADPPASVWYPTKAAGAAASESLSLSLSLRVWEGARGEQGSRCLARSHGEDVGRLGLAPSRWFGRQPALNCNQSGAQYRFDCVRPNM